VVNPSQQNPFLNKFVRTFLRVNNKVVYNNLANAKPYKQTEIGIPDYSDLYLQNYISVIEIANPMHSLWSDGRWNKLTMAHGCYWGKCTFCDISLDYIKVYEPIAAKQLVDKMEMLIEQTGEHGFHFVDEAAPPALMRALAIEIVKRGLVVTWWTNIRFEKSFTKDLCILLKASGCIAVSGGLEVASDRLLALIKKGVTVEQVAKVTQNFTQSGILVHAYLMYGFPSQTVQETVDSLEMVRQLFELGVIKSGFWHQFALTAHSPIGINPNDYQITPTMQPITFANNDIQFKDKTGIDHHQFSEGLRKSIFNYMHGVGFELPLQKWFQFKIPKPSIQSKFISSKLNTSSIEITKPTAKVIWLGNEPLIKYFSKSKKETTWQMVQLTFFNENNSFDISLPQDQGMWLVKTLHKMNIHANNSYSFMQLKQNFETNFENFELFWYSKPIDLLKKNGLISL
jgi:hypothetical protein